MVDSHTPWTRTGGQVVQHHIVHIHLIRRPGAYRQRNVFSPTRIIEEWNLRHLPSVQRGGRHRHHLREGAVVLRVSHHPHPQLVIVLRVSPKTQQQPVDVKIRFG